EWSGQAEGDKIRLPALVPWWPVRVGAAQLPRRPSVSLALLEGAALFAAVCGTIFVWGHPLLSDWLDVAVVLGQGAALSLSCIVAFYYNDLYDLRIVRNLNEFALRLLQSFGVALILLAGFYALFPGTRIAQGPFLARIVVT